MAKTSAVEPTATLQSTGRPSTEDVAKALRVGVRGVYKAKIVRRQRPDLADEVAAGRMTLNKAWQAATGKQASTTGDRLHAAWKAASADEKGEFIAMILDLVDRHD